MQNVLWAFLMIFAMGASSFDACAGHFPSQEQSSKIHNDAEKPSGHQDSSSEQQSPEHCCQIHVHIGTMPAPVRFVSNAPSQAPTFSRSLLYSGPSLIQNTRPPLAV